MALKKLSTGRPSLGERHTFAAKLPIKEAEKLRRIIEIEGTNAVAYIAKVMSDHLAQIDVEEMTGQEALPIDKAS